MDALQDTAIFCNWIDLCSNQSKERKTIVINLKGEW